LLSLFLLQLQQSVNNHKLYHKQTAI